MSASTSTKTHPASPAWPAFGLAAAVAATLAAAAALAPPDANANAQEKDDPRGVGRAFVVPYIRSDTNHYLVRVRLNGKGPFNFLVDTGAPALYVSTEAARKIALEPAKNAFWTNLERLDFEGGPWLDNVKCRVEDPFQLIGMNAMGLPGVSIDGILGFTVLARFRIVMDPTEDRMLWTRLDYEPREPFVPANAKRDVPADVKAMEMLGPAMKVVSLFTGKQPEPKKIPRGFLGIECAADHGPESLRVAAVWPDSPAARAGVQPGDVLAAVDGKPVADYAAARAALASVGPGRRLPLAFRRADQPGAEPRSVTLEIETGKGL